jgi:hypothetical protein
LEKKEKEVIDEKKKKLGISFKNAPFIKAKPYPGIILDKKKENTYFSFLWNFIFFWFYKNKKMNKIENSSKKTDKNSNNFRYVGKISNIPFLLKEKKNITNISTNNSVPIESFDYSAYKKSLQKKKE